MNKENYVSSGLSSSVGIPSVVVGVLIALKKVGMTTMEYSEIFTFGFEVFFVCIIIALVIWLVIMFLILIFGGFND